MLFGNIFWHQDFYILIQYFYGVITKYMFSSRIKTFDIALGINGNNCIGYGVDNGTVVGFIILRSFYGGFELLLHFLKGFTKMADFIITGFGQNNIKFPGRQF